MEFNYKKILIAVFIGLGVIALLTGLLTDIYSTFIGFILALLIWFIIWILVKKINGNKNIKKNKGMVRKKKK